MTEGKFGAGGIQRFQREGASIPEQNPKLFPETDFFQKKQEVIMNGAAEEIARKYKLGRDIAELLKTHEIDLLTPEFCKDFVENNPDYNGYHPALVRAVAEAIVADQEAEEVIRNIRH